MKIRFTNGKWLHISDTSYASALNAYWIKPSLASTIWCHYFINVWHDLCTYISNCIFHQMNKSRTLAPVSGAGLKEGGGLWQLIVLIDISYLTIASMTQVVFFCLIYFCMLNINSFKNFIFKNIVLREPACYICLHSFYCRVQSVK